MNFIFTFIVIQFSNTSLVRASEFSSSGYQLTITINENKDAEFSAIKLLTNSDSMQLISGYEYILPSSKPQSVVATLDGIEVGTAVYSIDNFNYSKVAIDFGSNVVKSGETKKLEIRATVKNFIKTKDNIKFFKVLASKDENANLRIYYPLSLGKPRLITASKSNFEEVGNNYLITFDKPDSMLVIWGESYTFDIKSKFELENPSSNSVQNLQDLPSDTYDQEVGIKSVANSKFGLYDRFGNSFAFTDIQANARIEGGFEAKIKKTFNQLAIVNTEKYNFGFPQENGIVKSILEETKDESNLFEKLRIANEFLFLNFRTNKELESAFDYSNVQGYWNTLVDKKDNFTSFDYCYVMTAFAEYLNLHAEINYGYIVLPDDFGNMADPQFWCSFEFENRIYLIDTYSLSTRGFDFFGAETEFDRIKFGVWTPTQVYNDGLGLLDKNNFVKQIEFAEISDYLIPENNIAIKKTQSTSVNSGFYHTLELAIENRTYKFVKIMDVIFDDNNFSQAKNFNNDLYLALLPNQTNEFILRKIRNYNFLANGLDSVKLDILLGHSEISQISTDVQIRYHPTQSILIFVLLSLIVLLLSIFVIITSIRFKKRNYYADK